MILVILSIRFQREACRFFGDNSADSCQLAQIITYQMKFVEQSFYKRTVAHFIASGEMIAKNVVSGKHPHVARLPL